MTWVEERSWTRPEATAVNRLPMTTFLRDRDRDHDADDVVSLDGPWAFTLLDRPGGTVRAEATLGVPGCWTMQGVGDPPHYTNIQMPFPGPPPRIPEANPTGAYRRTVTVPAAWAGRRIVLHVGGAETVLYVEIDGAFAGMGTDSRLPHEFDVTPFVTPGGECELALTVVRWGAATYLEDQDHWHHAGLHRSVLLYATPAVHVADVHAGADWDPATGDGRLTVRVAAGETAGANVTARIALDGTVVGEAPVRWEHPTNWVVNAVAFTGHEATIAVDVPGVEPWSAEHPRLHDVKVELVDGDGHVLDAVALRVGFRRVEVRGHELLINGRAALIKGVNRHDHDPRRGKAVTRESIRHDIELMKAHHLNAVRTSHYPNDPYLYEVCDELGMYVVDEANVESHSHLRSLTKQPEWLAAIVERVARMARRDKNHPSIVVWSLGNESGWSPAHDAAAAWLRAFDPSRPVQYESGYYERTLQGVAAPVAWHEPRRETDIVAPMYPPVADLVTWATMAPPERPLIMCECCHAMGNSCGGLDDYWAAIRTHAGIQGGFVWDWADQALVQATGDLGERLAYGGDFGDEPNDGAFCMNGLVATDRTPHPSLLEAKAVLQPVRFAWLGDGRMRITNEHDFTDLADAGPLDWSVTVDGEQIATGSLGPMAAAPGESVVVTIVLPTLALTGWQIAHLDVRIGTCDGQVELARSSVRSAPSGAASSGATAGIDTVLSMWRAPIDNDVFIRPSHADRWERLGLRHADLPLRTEVDGDLVTHEVRVPEEWDDLPRVGVRLALPADVVAVEWLGRGPHECYSDRQASARFGRWRTAIDDWPVSYVHPQASGNRIGVRSLRFLDAAGDTVLVVDELDDLDVTVSRWTDDELADATHLEELPARDHAFAWLDAAHRGVGSGAVGPDVAPAHRVRAGTYRWSYRLRPR
ncbi:MAG: glycoside hydrolase family 2 TIM barrel-domain containing protein [Ilumatobacteraceae bacterium]